MGKVKSFSPQESSAFFRHDFPMCESFHFGQQKNRYIEHVFVYYVFKLREVSDLKKKMHFHYWTGIEVLEFSYSKNCMAKCEANLEIFIRNKPFTPDACPIM